MDALVQLKSALAGRYAIDREIGAGGMATVYLARDVRHERNVALKVLNPELGAVLGVERFLSEIKVTANLQHPNLLPLFDSGEAEGLLFYVMPYVQGESLRARLEREKQLPIEEAVRIATAIASALDYAHRHGVIHRDLKPENILLHEGQPLIADFGIALAVSKAGGNRITQTGLSLGTPQYMSPEQATGDRAIDGRTDIYSLGAMLYEMLAGEPPHLGNTAQAIIAKVLTDKPRSVRLSRDTVPVHVEQATDRALAKLPADRFATAQELADALSGKLIGVSSAAVAIPQTIARASYKRPFIASTVVAAVMAAGFVWLLLHPNAIPDAPVVRTTIELPPSDLVYDAATGVVAVAPQGDRIAYTLIGTSGTPRVAARRTSELAAHDLTLYAAVNLSFSPDGRWIAYTRGNGSAVSKVQVDGGANVTLGSLDNSTANGLSWMGMDTIIVGASTGLWELPSGGGVPRRLFPAESSVAVAPVVLSDGKTLLYATGPANDARRLAVGSLITRTRAVLDIPAIAPLGFREGHLLYVDLTGAVMAVPFDVKHSRVTGDPVQVQDSVRLSTGTSGASGAVASLSTSGTLVYLNGASQSQLVLAAGGTDVPLLPEPHNYNAPRFSPDGRKVAVTAIGTNSNDIWVYDLAARTFTRLTTEGANGVPEWSPDGKRLLYRSDRTGKRTIAWQSADGSDKAQVLYQPDELVNEAILSPDEKWLVYRTSPGTRNASSIFAVPLPANGKPAIPIVTGPGTHRMPRFSPDGRWLAYESDESGRLEVYVRPFPNAGARVQVSNQGGTEPLWGRSGRTLYYRTASGIETVAVSGESTLSLGERRSVLTGSYLSDPTHPNYDVAPDGTHFLLLKPAGPPAKLVLVANWGRELREKLAGKR